MLPSIFRQIQIGHHFDSLVCFNPGVASVVGHTTTNSWRGMGLAAPLVDSGVANHGFWCQTMVNANILFRMWLQTRTWYRQSSSHAQEGSDTGRSAIVWEACTGLHEPLQLQHYSPHQQLEWETAAPTQANVSPTTCLLRRLVMRRNRWPHCRLPSCWGAAAGTHASSTMPTSRPLFPQLSRDDSWFLLMAGLFESTPSPLLYCPASRTTLVATRFWVVMICPIIKCLTVLEFSFYFVWFVFIHHNFQFYFKLCTYCNILDIYLS